LANKAAQVGYLSTLPYVTSARGFQELDRALRDRAVVEQQFRARRGGIDAQLPSLAQQLQESAYDTQLKTEALAVNQQSGQGWRRGVQPSSKQQRHGVLAELGHVAGQTLSDLETAAIHSPAGVYQLGKAIAVDTAAALHGRPSNRSRKILTEMGKATVQDIK